MNRSIKVALNKWKQIAFRMGDPRIGVLLNEYRAKVNEAYLIPI
jgi:hypothetical protein